METKNTSGIAVYTMKQTIKLLIMSLLFLLIATLSYAEIKTFTYTVKQPFGGSQSPDDARIASIAKAKREVLELAGTYLESLTVVKNQVVVKDEILALAAGVLKTKIVSQKNYATEDAFGIVVVAKVEVDTNIMEKRVKRLLQDRTLLKKYRKIQQREKELLAKVERLEKLNRKFKSSTSQEQELELEKENLKKYFKKVSNSLTAVKWKKKALALWDNGEYTDPIQALGYLNKAIYINPYDADAHIDRGIAYANIGDINKMCSDFRKACKLGNCTAITSVKKNGDCR